MGASRWRVVIVAWSAVAVGAFAAVLVTLLMRSPGPRLSKDAEEIRGLIPVAAACGREEFLRHVVDRPPQHPSRFRRAEDQNLTLLFADGLSWREHEPWSLDCEFHPDRGGYPKALGRERMRRFEGQGYVTYILPDEISSFTCQVEGSVAKGRFVFRADGMWEGRADFRAEKWVGRWTVTGFRLPGGRYFVLRRADGTWKGYWREAARPKGDHLYEAVIARDGRFFLMRRLCDRPRLLEYLQREIRRAEDGSYAFGVILRADPDAPHRHLRRFADICAEAGLRRLALWRLEHFQEVEIGAAPEVKEHVRIRLAVGDAPPGKLPRGEFSRLHEAIYAEIGSGRYARVALFLGKERCRSLSALTAKLRDLRRKAEHRSALIEAAKTVPFLWTYGAVEACRDAGIETITLASGSDVGPPKHP